MSEKVKLVPLDAVRGDERRLEFSGAWVLDQIEHYIGRFVAYPSEHARVAHALWIAHTHLMQCWESTPRLAFVSPERGSGKTRALEVTEPLVLNPVHAVNVTPAYLFRKVGEAEVSSPTILYDEVDTLFGSKVQDTGEVRGLLNAGHRRGAVAGRCVVVGRKVQTEEIPAYCAVALAGIGNLPDTIASRSVIIQMRRRASDEPVEPFRHRVHARQAASIRDLLGRWCDEIAPSVRDARPAMPKGVEDRNADCWEPLLAIADAAGGDWPSRARSAALSLIAGAVDQMQTTGVQLLSDLYEVFDGAEKLWTETILSQLHKLPESAWGDVRGKPLNDRSLAAGLRKYSVKSRDVRIGDEVRKGYLAADFHDVWKRYVLPIRKEALQALQALQLGRTTKDTEWGAAERAETISRVADVADVALVRDSEGDAYDFEERAAIAEYDGGLTRAEAEARAAEEMLDIPAFLDRRTSHIQ